MKRPLSSDWFRDKTPKDKESIEYVIRNNTILVQSVLDVLDRYEKEEARQDILLTEYDSPSWAYKQADRNGARRTLNKVRSLFTFD